MNCIEWIDKAKFKIKTLPTGNVFVLKDLFLGTDWKSLKVGDRLSLGRNFKNEVLDKRIENVVYIGKADNNSAKYKKIEEN